MFTKFTLFPVWILSRCLIYDIHAKCTPSNTLLTQPFLPNNILASGYVNLTLQACFNSTYVGICSWKHGSFDESFYNEIRHCYVPTTVYDAYYVDCFSENQIVETNLTIWSPVSMGDNLFTLYCLAGSVLTNFVLTTNVSVQNCPSSLLDNEITVVSRSHQYDARGNFACPENSKLFDGNGIYKNDSSTVCNEFAEWENSSNLQCWRAPRVALTTNSTKNGRIVNVKEGNGISFSCNYNDVTPSGDQSVFNFNGAETIEKKEKSFVISNINKMDQDKAIFCQAATNYTEIFKEEGKSEVLHLNVLFEPYIEKPTVCYWEDGLSQICVVEFFSNPMVLFVSLTKQGNVTIPAKSQVMLTSKENFQRSFYFIKIMASTNDTGFYHLNVYSSAFSMNYTIIFQIVVSTTNATNITSANTSLVAVSATMGVMFLLSLIANGFLLQKLNKTKEKFDSKVTPKCSAQVHVSHSVSSPSSSLKNADQKLSKTNKQNYENMQNSNEVKEDKDGYIIFNSFASNKQESAAQPTSEYEMIGGEKPCFSGNDKAEYINPTQFFNTQPPSS